MDAVLALTISIRQKDFRVLLPLSAPETLWFDCVLLSIIRPSKQYSSCQLMNEGPLGPFSIWPLDVLCIRRLATLVNLLQLDGFTFRLGSSRSGTCVLGDLF